MIQWIGQIMPYLKQLIETELSLTQKQWNRYVDKHDAELKRDGRFIANMQRGKIEAEIWTPLEIRYLRDGIDRIMSALEDKLLIEAVQEDGTLKRVEDLLEKTPQWLIDLAPKVFRTFYGLQIHFILPLHRVSWDAWVNRNVTRYPLEHPEVVTHFIKHGPNSVQIIDTLGPYDEITSERHPGIKYTTDGTMLLTLPCGYSPGKVLWHTRRAAERKLRTQRVNKPNPASIRSYLATHPEIIESFKDAIRSVIQYYNTGGNNGYNEEVKLEDLPKEINRDALIKAAKLEATKQLARTHA